MDSNYDTEKNMLPLREDIVPLLSRTNGNGVYCEENECTYCLSNHYCSRICLPRNEDGYCKDFIPIND